VDTPGRVARTALEPPAGRGSGRTAGPALLRAAVLAPVTGRARTELLYCVLAPPVGLAVLLAAVGLLALGGWLGPGPGKPDNASIGGLAAALLVLLLATTWVARGVGAVHRYLAARLLDERIAPPSEFRPGRGLTGRLAARLRDGTGWRAAGYLLLRLPVGLLQVYAVAFWVTGSINLSCPLWWVLFRNHPPDVQLRPVPIVTPFATSLFEIDSYAGTFGALPVGGALILAAPWLTRAATAVDRPLIRGLLGPGALAQRVHELEQTRASAVDDSAALLRRLERDLHDGAQIRLAALALNLGMAKEKLDAGADLDVPQIRDLVGIAHQGAKDALVELRDLARGIHPPVLDGGLADALVALTEGSAVPVELTTDIPDRPTQAIESIAYFCAAELLTNAAKHSYANAITVRAAEREGALVLSVADDGVGGADPHGGGLSGLRRRVRAVDGRLDLESPPGGPTRVTVVLPLRA
jgi:signal transduction histidine kinase